jgi:hypothetical protein
LFGAERSDAAVMLLQLRHTGNRLTWGLVTFTVQSAEDLKAMREALKDHIEWFEVDLTGFTTIRSLHDAAIHGSGFDIKYQRLREILDHHDDAGTADRASWAKEESDDELPEWVQDLKAEQVRTQ